MCFYINLWKLGVCRIIANYKVSMGQILAPSSNYSVSYYNLHKLLRSKLARNSMAKTIVPLQPGELWSLSSVYFVKKKQIQIQQRLLFVVFLLHVGSDLGILIHRLEVTIDLLVGLENGLRNTIQHPSIEPAHQPPDGQVGDGHLVAHIEPCNMSLD